MFRNNPFQLSRPTISRNKKLHDFKPLNFNDENSGRLVTSTNCGLKNHRLEHLLRLVGCIQSFLHSLRVVLLSLNWSPASLQLQAFNTQVLLLLLFFFVLWLTCYLLATISCILTNHQDTAPCTNRLYANVKSWARDTRKHPARSTENHNRLITKYCGCSDPLFGITVDGTRDGRFSRRTEKVII